MTNYQKQAEDFCGKTNTTIEVKFSHHGAMPFDKGTPTTRDVYNITISRPGRTPYIFPFGQSIARSYYADDNEYRRIVGSRQYWRERDAGKRGPKREAPTAYDILACLTTYDPGTYEEFCSEFGYEGGEGTLQTWAAVREEYASVTRLFGDCMEDLYDIC